MVNQIGVNQIGWSNKMSSTKWVGRPNWDRRNGAVDEMGSDEKGTKKVDKMGSDETWVDEIRSNRVKALPGGVRK